MLVNWTDILDGAIANAALGVVSMVKLRTPRNVAGALDTAAWADTERLIRDTLAEIAADHEMPGRSEDEVAELEAMLKRHEVQGALQALLAVRLTDSPEADATRARQAVQLALAGARGSQPTGFLSEQYAQRLSEYFDDKISALVGDLEGRIGLAGLAQVRAEAYSSRIVALLGAIDQRMAASADSERGGQATPPAEVIGGQGVYAGNGGVQFNFFGESDTDRIAALLGAIERQVAALADPNHGTKGEAEFLERYRRQAHQRHGFLTPPDFDRRRRIPVDDIYVPTGISGEGYSEHARLPPETASDSLKVWDLTGRIGRTVLLGDPGGGKTTAANVLTDRIASDPAQKIPFLVTLREYAAKSPIEWSVTECIERNLATLYQSHAPNGLVERLLLTGRAIVIFDGLDELLDTSRRRDVSERVEQFCSAYPLTMVLVTSRVVGYDQARLDDTQFTCYRLGGFGGNEVAEYARKWFTTQDGMPPAEAAAKAEAFLTESANAEDLRANPLLLSLMCILYRGAGALPGDRVGIYARCAELLLRKWDEQRDLYRRLGSDHLVEPTLRYLAWWLFTREDSQTAATERELVAKSAEFLHERGYETEEEARAAAREFVAFCRGRMWVFSDAGTTADGEKLYGFTHRTFMEYFAAWHLAATSDTPEDLAQTLIERKLKQPGSDVVAELAIKVKSDSSDRGADRIFAFFLDSTPNLVPYAELVELLIDSLGSAKPSPATVRRLTQVTLNLALTDRKYLLLFRLLDCGALHKQLIAGELSNRIITTASSEDMSTRAIGLLLVFEVAVFAPDEFWRHWSAEKITDYTAEITTEAMRSNLIRTAALNAGAISLKQALAMPGGFGALMEEVAHDLPQGLVLSYPMALFMNWDHLASRDTITEAAAIGEYLVDHPGLPWIHAKRNHPTNKYFSYAGVTPNGELSGLGIAAISAITKELSEEPRSEYSELPMPTQFRQVFQNWAEGRVDFVEFPRE